MRDLQLFFCSSITGEFFKTLGQYGKKLECLMIHRFDSEGSGILDQVKDMHIGGGVLENLKQFGLFGEWEIDDQFVDSVIANAPNLQSLQLLDLNPAISCTHVVRLINAYDLKELHITITEDQSMIDAIKQKKNLNSLAVQEGFTLDMLKQLEIPSLTYFKGPVEIESEQYLEALHAAFLVISGRFAVLHLCIFITCIPYHLVCNFVQNIIIYNLASQCPTTSHTSPMEYSSNSPVNGLSISSSKFLCS